jgi:signal transduction histidine kinase
MRLLLALLTLTLMAVFEPQVAVAAELPVLELHAGEDAAAVAPFVRFTTQSGDTETPELGPLLRQPLERILGSTIHFGPPGTKTVALLKLRNNGAAQGSWILTTGRGSLKHFRLFEAENDRLKLLVDGTNPRDAQQNLGTYQAFSAELVLDPAQEKLILIEFLSENSTYMPLKIETYGSFFKDRRANISMVSAVVVGALTLLLLNFLFFSITGFKEFLWLAVAELFFALNTIHSEGYITIFFLYDKPLTGVAVEDFIKCGFAAAMAQFGRSFVNTSSLFPRRDVALRVLIASALIIMTLQPGLSFYPPEFRFFLHLLSWIVAVAVALFLPFVGYAAMKQLGFQLWPLFVGWASLALFIVYSAIASMGVFTWLPVNWHLAGPIGLFESVMVTLALGLNLKKIQHDKLAADANYARSLAEELATSERAKRLAEEKAFALETVNSQNALLHASGHDSRQVILALNSAVAVLKRDDRPDADGALVDMLQSSADYLSEIISTTISGANIAASASDFVALSSFRAQALLEPLSMMFKTLFANKHLTLDVAVEGAVTLISDKPLLMRALANLLSNSCNYTDVGGATISVTMEGARAVIMICDSGKGMPPEVAAALNTGSETRIRADDEGSGTGSGFGSAKRIIESLRGSLEIISSNPSGTEIRIVLPVAAETIVPISSEDLAVALHGWQILDFDQREAFKDGLRATGPAKDRVIALTYDDTTVTRGRLSSLAAMVVIKPACRELLQHPLLSVPSQQI